VIDINDSFLFQLVNFLFRFVVKEGEVVILSLSYNMAYQKEDENEIQIKLKNLFHLESEEYQTIFGIKGNEFMSSESHCFDILLNYHLNEDLNSANYGLQMEPKEVKGMFPDGFCWKNVDDQGEIKESDLDQVGTAVIKEINGLTSSHNFNTISFRNHSFSTMFLNCVPISPLPNVIFNIRREMEVDGKENEEFLSNIHNLSEKEIFTIIFQSFLENSSQNTVNKSELVSKTLVDTTQMLNFSSSVQQNDNNPRFVSISHFIQYSKVFGNVESHVINSSPLYCDLSLVPTIYPSFDLILDNLYLSKISCFFDGKDERIVGFSQEFVVCDPNSDNQSILSTIFCPPHHNINKSSYEFIESQTLTLFSVEKEEDDESDSIWNHEVTTVMFTRQKKELVGIEIVSGDGQSLRIGKLLERSMSDEKVEEGEDLEMECQHFSLFDKRFLGLYGHFQPQRKIENIGCVFRENIPQNQELEGGENNELMNMKSFYYLPSFDSCLSNCLKSNPLIMNEDDDQQKAILKTGLVQISKYLGNFFCFPPSRLDLFPFKIFKIDTSKSFFSSNFDDQSPFLAEILRFSLFSFEFVTSFHIM